MTPGFIPFIGSQDDVNGSFNLAAQAMDGHEGRLSRSNLKKNYIQQVKNGNEANLNLSLCGDLTISQCVLSRGKRLAMDDDWVQLLTRHSTDYYPRGSDKFLWNGTVGYMT